MAKNSKRAAAAIASIAGELMKLDSLPPLKSLNLLVFFNNDGDITQVTPRFDVRTDRANLTDASAPSP